MIANIDRGENLLGALSYNQLKVDKDNAQILFTHKMVETVDGNYSISQLLRSFEPYLTANKKTEKPVLHISLNPDPRDCLTDEKLQAIAEDYMEQMGYGNQPYAVFKHMDIDRSHIHIVSVCVDEEGRKISDAFEKRRSVKISRDLEVKYGLQQLKEKDTQSENLIFRPVNYKIGDVKSQISSVVRYLPKYYKFQSMGEYNALLSLFNVTAQEVKGELHGEMRQGIVYFALNEIGERSSNPFKASLFGRQASYLKLQDHFLNCTKSVKDGASLLLLKNTIEQAIHNTKNESGFKSHLLDKGINIVVRRNAENRIFGITFIDHNSKMVCNGSRLGKEFSAGVFNDWWNNNKKSEIKSKNDRLKYVEKSDVSKQDRESYTPFDFIIKEDLHGQNYGEDLLGGLGGLLPESHGDDIEEQLFAGRMKKKKRRGSR
ncbi:MAG: relaxase/mobilization nuclease domain-containing protein [Sphingobacteriaceae bacterium]|nr:relaxase/mobilization nuclease domain-containing protein [Sphingobacteriaceae bacterium]